MTLCRPDLNVGTRHSCKYLSPGFRHTIHCLDCFPTSTELSSVHMIRIQSSLVNCTFSLAHSFLFRMWFALRNGFLAATRRDISRPVFRALWTVVEWTGEGRAELASEVMFWRDCRRSRRMLRLRWRRPRLPIIRGLPTRGSFSLWPLSAPLWTIDWTVRIGRWK